MITRIPEFKTLTEYLDWCWDVRIGKIKTSPEIRNRAKVVTFARAYSMPNYALALNMLRKL